MSIEKKRIGIVGIKGKFGNWFRKYFRRIGFSVIGYDAGAKDHRVRKVIESSDVVIFCVPISAFAGAVERAIPFSRKGQLWLDVTSVKAEPLRAMLGSRASVIGLHPLFAAPYDADGDIGLWGTDNVVVCHGRVSNKWSAWFDSFLSQVGGTVHLVDPIDHDRVMQGAQNQVHIALLTQALTLQSLEIEPADLSVLSTRLSRLQFGAMARMLSQPPSTYGEIQMFGSQGLVTIDALLVNLQRLRSIVARGDTEAFESEFRRAARYFGADLLGRMVK